MAIVLSVLLRFTTSCYRFGILWPLYCLSFLDLRLLITLLVSCGHCIVCHSSIYDFWLPFWYLLVIFLSVLPRFTTSVYPFRILWLLYCLSFLDLRLLITPLVSFCHSLVCPSSIYDVWLPLWYVEAIVLSVIPRFCIVCHSSICDFWLSSWYLVAIVLSVLPRFCIFCHSSICDFWLSFWYLVAIVLSVIPRFCIVCHSSICDFWLPFWYLVAIALSVLPRSTTSDYPFGIFWPLYCLSFLDLRLLITPLVSCDHCIVCPSSIYDFWLPLWYLLAIVLSVLPRSTTSDYPLGIFWPLYCLSFLDFVFSVIPRFATSDYPFGILWPLYCLSFLDFVLSVIPRFATSDYPFGILWPLHCLSFLDLRLLITPLVSFGHCIVCPSSIYDFWLPLWYLVTIVLSVLPRSTTSDYPFGIFWPLYCISFLEFRLLITLLVSCDHCIVCPSSIYDFWYPLWYLLAIVLSVLPRFTTSDNPFGILWPLYCLSFLDLRLLITPLVSCGHCIFCHSSILYCLSFLDFRLMITPLVSFGHCVVCTSSIYDLWLSFWYLVAIVLSVRPRFTTSDYPFGILWPLYCLSFLD